MMTASSLLFKDHSSSTPFETAGRAQASSTASTKHQRLTICIVTDAWHPQVNGVVRTLDHLQKELKATGHSVVMITPKLFRTVPCPTYPEIRLSLASPKTLCKIFSRFQPDAIHIATEGPLGWAARAACKRLGRGFTTAYHTAFPEYIQARTGLSSKLFYPVMRRFHAPSNRVLVATKTVRSLLRDHGFKNIFPWTRGVDTKLFKPVTDAHNRAHPRLLYVGRVAVEKNIEAFLTCDSPGEKRVVGDGPAKQQLQQKYPDVQFMGPKFGTDLAAEYGSADVLVFPSKTDTFGLVMIEALAAGTPVAAYPVQGPLDVVGHNGTGPKAGAHAHWNTPIASLNGDLATAIAGALPLDRRACRAFAALYDWSTVAEQFVQALSLHSTQPPYIPPKTPHTVAHTPA